ncbi:MAG: hypothetical protein U5K54_15390 [Cytophagales bacterium]|nr:hypothetical protein [Cytophagales bacterium]
MNRMYHLSPVSAFQQNLVKKIEVFGITEQNNMNDNQLSFFVREDKAGYGLALEAKLNVLKDGKLISDTIKLRKGDDLYEKTKNHNFEGLVIEEINRKRWCCRFYQWPNLQGCRGWRSNPFERRDLSSTD